MAKCAFRQRERAPVNSAIRPFQPLSFGQRLGQDCSAKWTLPTHPKESMTRSPRSRSMFLIISTRSNRSHWRRTRTCPRFPRSKRHSHTRAYRFQVRSKRLRCHRRAHSRSLVRSWVGRTFLGGSSSRSMLVPHAFKALISTSNCTSFKQQCLIKLYALFLVSAASQLRLICCHHRHLVNAIDCIKGTL